MTVFVVTEIEPEHAQTRTIVKIFESKQKAEAFVAKELAALASGQHGGFATDKTSLDLWWEIDEFTVE